MPGNEGTITIENGSLTTENIMKIRIFLTSILLSSLCLTGNAETKTARSAHEAAHKQQLANMKSRLDKSVITNLIKEDIVRHDIKEDDKQLTPESTAMINDLLSEARTHMGKPYRGGAKGPKAFDCSGFSSYVYRQFGYSISPSSRQQYTEGVKVERNELRKGDLVFFTSRRSGKNVGHVGIVVSADNEKGTFQFIHASIKGVKVSDFEGYYVPRYVGARRIITE